MNKGKIYLNEQCLNSILLYIDKYNEIIEKELFEFFDKNIILRDCDKTPLIKKLISFKIVTNNKFGRIFFNDGFLIDGTIHFNTLCCYNIITKHWSFFWGNISDEDKLKACNFMENSLARKIKINKLLKNE